MKQSRVKSAPNGQFKRRLLHAAMMSAFSGAAVANPSGPAVVNGQVSFNQQGNTLAITNSPNAIINWQSFSINGNETTRFVQQSAASSVLNRVTGIDPSIILGTLQSNGRVFLVNPSGIIFGQGSRVDVAGLVASTLNLNNQDFLAGRLNFTDGALAGRISNQGVISTPAGGSVILVAPQIDNSGIINAPNGDVILAAGRSVRLGDTAAPNVLVEIQAPDTHAVNVGDIVVAGGNASIYAGLINQRGIVKADTPVLGENGKVTFRATKSLNLESGSLTSASGGAQGGSVSLEAPVLYQLGAVHADGAAGGSVSIRAGGLLQAGAITADGAHGKGGDITVNVDAVIQTQSALLSVRGETAGGRIVVNAAANGNGLLFSSATFLATGAQGGEIELLGHDIILLGARANASGSAGGGTILIGGDYQGNNPAVPNADSTWINYSTSLRADAGTTGAGGKVIVWSDNDTRFAGAISARGGAQSGNGGFIEVSGKDSLRFAGTADASAPKGTPGTVLLDPKNIIIDSTGGGLASFQLIDPHPDANALFGQRIAVLPNENVLVTDPNDGFGGISAGAVYLFDGSTGALISALTGSGANDSVGSLGVTVLNSGNYVVNSPNWNGFAGAVTWGSGTAGVSGAVSAANSLVGTAGDTVGSAGIAQLASGNYLVFTPNWTNGGNGSQIGAVTWGSGTTGVTGVVSAANSLVGNATGDLVGSNGIFELSSGNYLVLSPNWTNGGTGIGIGAVTWGSGAAGVSGVVSAGNSLVGSTAGDFVGSGGITQLFPSGNYVVQSPNWTNGGTGTNVGAVTWGSGTAGISGVVSAANSLVGSTAGDAVGSGGVIPLNTNGNYVVLSPGWTNGGDDVGAGAVTWGSGTTGVSGAVSAGNSLVGSTAGDAVGFGGIIELFPSGNYLVLSPHWTNGGTGTSVGAVTWGSGTAGITGVLSAGNSLVGSTTGDTVGSGGIAVLFNTGNYAVSSPNWNGNAGAVTWGSGTTGVSGVVTAANSLVGSTTGDAVGSGGITELSSGNYLVSSPAWTNGGTGTNVGAVTFGSGVEGISGAVAAGNSLVGSATGDAIGSGAIVQLFTGGNYLVISPNWNGAVGAVTWGSGTQGVSGAVSAANSLVGTTAGDSIGSGGINQLISGNYVVTSPNWTNGGAPSAGAVTFGNGATGIVGEVSAINSLVGSATGDSVGSGTVLQLANGNFVVLSPAWTNGGAGANVGAVTWGSGTAGVSGVVSAVNSLVGSATNDAVGAGLGVVLLTNGNYVVKSLNWNGNAGAATWGSGTAGVNGTVSASNSLVGGTAGDSVGSGGIVELSGSGNYVVSSPDWTNGGAGTRVGAVTWGSGTAGVTGVVSATNSLVGSTTGDAIGSAAITQLSVSGNYLVSSAGWNGNAGAVTWGSSTAGVTGVVSATNSLVGSTPGDGVGSNGVVELFPSGNYVVLSPGWNAGAGAATWGSGTAGISGVVSATNSLVGSTPGDAVGSAGIVQLFVSGDYLVRSPNWANGAATAAGAVTFGSSTTGVFGALSTANSLLGAAANDQLGSGSIFQSLNGNVVVSSPLADNGAVVDAGIVQVVTPGIAQGAPASGQTFASNPAGTVTITPAAIAAITNTGTAVTLQANNDITLNPASDVITSAAGNGGAITLEAGRSILLRSSITTDNGELIITANHPGADAANRDPGAGGITMAPGTALNAGTGNATLTVGPGVPGAASGNLVVDKITGVSVALLQNGNTDGSSILRAAASSLIQATNLTLAIAGGGGSIGSQANPILTSGVIHLTTSVPGFGATAVQNANGAGGQALIVNSMTSGGGGISLVNDTDITVDNAQITSLGGNIVLQSTAGSIAGDGQIEAAASAVDAGNFPNGGNITLSAAGDINLTGVNVLSAGFSPADGTIAAGRGGNIDMQAGGSIDIQGVSAPGGNGNSASTVSAAGGAGGTITLTAQGTVTVRSAATADGGVGATGNGDNLLSGPGGHGGSISIRAAGPSIATGFVTALGGAGGDDCCGRPGGAGGVGGIVSLEGSGTAFGVSANLINVSGGNGGSSAGAAVDGPGGDGGTIAIFRTTPGDITVNAPSLQALGGGSVGDGGPGTGSGGAGGTAFVSAISSSLQQHVNPGTPGSLALQNVRIDVAGGAGGVNGAQGAVDLQAGDGGITQGAAFSATTTDIRLETSGSVSLTNQANLIPGIWGSVGGNLSVASLGPVQLGLANPANFTGPGLLSIGGNLVVQSVAGSQRTVPVCTDAPDSCVYFDQPLTAGGNIEFYADDLHDQASITTGQLDANYVRQAPWTAGRDLVFDPADPIQAEHFFSPHLQLGNPAAIATPTLATYGTVVITGTVEPASFSPVTRSFDVYANQIDINAQVGVTNVVPVSFGFNARTGINVGTTDNTTIRLASGRKLTLFADADLNGSGNLTLGNGNGFVTLAFDAAASSSDMELRGFDVLLQGAMDLTQYGGGTLAINAQHNVRLSNATQFFLNVGGQGLTSVTAGGDLTVESLGSGGTQIAGDFANNRGSQAINIGGDLVMTNSAAAGSTAALFAMEGQTVNARSVRLLGAAGGSLVTISSIGSGGQTIATTGAGANGWGIEVTNNGTNDGFNNGVRIQSNNGQIIQVSGSNGILLDAQGGGASIFSIFGTQSISTTGQLALHAGSAPDAGQALFQCNVGGWCAQIAAFDQSLPASTVQQDVTAGSIEILAGAGGAYNQAGLTSNGSQRVTVTGPGGILVQGGGGAGNFAQLGMFGGSGFAQTIDFGSGDLRILGGTSGGYSLAEVAAGGNQTISGTGNIVIAGGVLPGNGAPARHLNGTNTVVDAVVWSFADINNNFNRNPQATQSITANSISITALPSQSSTGIFSSAGLQTISTTGGDANGFGLTLRNTGAAGGPEQGGFPTPAAYITSNGTQVIDIANSAGLRVLGDAGFSIINAGQISPNVANLPGLSQTITVHGTGANAILVQAGQGPAEISSFSQSQQLKAGLAGEAGSISIRGGTQTGAIADIKAETGSQTLITTGQLSLTGGTAPQIAPFNYDQTDCLPACASLYSPLGLQTIDADSILVQGGASGSENLASIRSNSGQSITVRGPAGLTILGGGAAGTNTDYSNFAIIENYGGAQTVTFTSPAAPLASTGGTVGLREFAGIFAGTGTTSQQILGSPVITLAGGASGGGGTGNEPQTQGVGNTGFIIAQAGSQRIDAASIAMTGGGGAGENVVVVATWAPGASQVINSTGGISLAGGSAVFASAEMTSGGPQTISAGGITLAGGSASGLDAQDNPIGNAFAHMLANGTQSITITGGGAITLTGGTNSTGGGAASNSVEIASASGFDQIIAFQTGGTIALTGGASGRTNDATIGAGKNQTINGNPAVTLAGGAGESAQASINNDDGAIQTLRFSSLSLAGGTGADASASIAGGTNQAITVTGATSLTGGTGNGAGAIIGTSTHDITINLTTGSLALQAGTGDIVTDGSAAVAAIGAVKAAVTSGLPNAAVTISSSGDVALTGATSSTSQPVLALIGTDTTLGAGSAVGITAGGNIVEGGNALIRGSRVSLSAPGDVTLGQVVATGPNPTGGVALAVAAGTGGTLGIDAQNANLTAEQGSISLSSPTTVRVGAATAISAPAGSVTITAAELNLTGDYTLPSNFTLRPFAGATQLTGPGHTLTSFALLSKISNITVNLINQGTFVVPSATTTALTAGAGGNGSYALTDGSSLLRFDSGTYTLGNITGPGGVMINEATVGVSGTYDVPGTTNINGTLNLNGSGNLGNVTVAGTLGGTGTVSAGRLTLAGGTLAGTGSLTVGDFVDNGGAHAITSYHDLALTRLTAGTFVAGQYTAANSLSLAAPGGALQIQDVTLTAPTVSLSGANVILQPGGSNGSQVNAANSLTISTPGTLSVDASSGPASINSAGTVSIHAAAVNVKAGNFAAKIDPTTLDLAVVNDIVLTGGSAPNTPALLSGNNVTLNAANVILTGGAGNGSYAAIEGLSGNTTVTARNSIIMNPGTGLNADASIVGRSGVTLNAASCTGCVSLASDPLSNTATDQGVFGAPVVFNVGVASVPVDPSIIYAAGISSDGGLANTTYLTSATDEEEQKSSSNEDEDSGNQPKRTIPVCM